MITQRIFDLLKLIVFWLLPLSFISPALAQIQTPGKQPVLISNCLQQASNGIAWVLNDCAAFVVNPEKRYRADKYQPDTAAPDDSYHLCNLKQVEGKVVFEWGRVGNGIVGRITTDKPMDLTLWLSSGWPNWTSTFQGTPDGAIGRTDVDGKEVTWKLRTSPQPKLATSEMVQLALVPGKPVYLVAGLGEMQEFTSVADTLEKARTQYLNSRPHASGDWGDFVGAIADTVNNSRIYANDNHLLAHTVSRNWFRTPNTAPYFCWDSFFTANLAAIDDPVIARNTVRAILSCQTGEGLVPNHGHWHKGVNGSSIDRSQPPVGSWCVWKMHQRYLNDLEFLAEVYPKLVVWHDWWFKARDAKGDGLLEWGSSDGTFQAAQWETGWDDNLHFNTATMAGKTMNCYAIDLCALWAQDAHYLALLADVLGKKEDSKRFRRNETDMNQRINERLWNPKLNLYCSRFWNDAQAEEESPSSAFANGFDAEFFGDENLQQHVATRHDKVIDFNWGGKSPVQGVGKAHWSARWTGSFTAPAGGVYRFHASADDGVRVIVNGSNIIDHLQARNTQDLTGDLVLVKNQKVPVVVEYVQHDSSSSLHLAVNHLLPNKGEFLTRLTPMNFYPLSSGAANPERAKLVLAQLTNPAKFWGKYRLPTLAYDDPGWHQQQYWRGKVWGPVNYIAFDGIKRYANAVQIRDYAESGVNLFMSNWTSQGLCGENYLSTTGRQSSDPHYTWGALLCLIGLESIVDVDDEGEIVLNGTQTGTIELKNIPLLGRHYDVKTTPGTAVLLHEGKVVLEAKGQIIRAKLN